MYAKVLILLSDFARCCSVLAQAIDIIDYVVAGPRGFLAQLREAMRTRNGNHVLTGNSLLFSATMQILRYIGATEGSATIHFGVRDFEIIHGFPDFSYDF